MKAVVNGISTTGSAIESDLRRKIAVGTWTVGTLLPPRRQLARDYGVPLATIERAVAPLLSDGTLRANPRQGTIVAEGQGGGTAAARRRHPSIDQIGERVGAGAKTLGILAGIKIPPVLHRSDDWGLSILSAVERTFAAMGRTHVVNLYVDEFTALPTRDAIKRVLKMPIDALLYLLPPNTDEVVEALIDMRITERLPVVIASKSSIKRPLPNVYFDVFGSGYSAAQHLVRCGHDRFVFVCPFSDDWVRARLQGAALAISDAGLPVEALTVFKADASHIMTGNDYQLLPEGEMWSPANRSGAIADYDGATQVAASKLCVEEGFDSGAFRNAAIIAANDLVGKEVIEAAQRRALLAGVDFSVIGFDDRAYSPLIGLSSMRPPIDEMGQAAARLAIQALKGFPPETQIRYNFTLIPRLSTRVAAEEECNELRSIERDRFC